MAAATPPLDPESIALLTAALVIGCAMGWLRGRSIKIDVHPETHDITARASPIGLVFIFALLAVRFGLRDFALETAPGLHLSFIAIADAFVLLAVGMMVVQGLEMWIRARQLLAEAQAANPAAPPPNQPPPMPKIIT